MEQTLSFATWLALCGPMPVVLLLSVVSFVLHKRRGRR
jgi:hypothetical protein